MMDSSIRTLIVLAQLGVGNHHYTHIASRVGVTPAYMASLLRELSLEYHFAYKMGYAQVDREAHQLMLKRLKEIRGELEKILKSIDEILAKHDTR